MKHRTNMVLIVGAATSLVAAGVQATPIVLTGTHAENFDTLINTGGTGGGSIPINQEIVNAQFWTGTGGADVSTGWWNGSGTSFGSSSDGSGAANSNRILSLGGSGVAERALGLGWREGPANTSSIIGAQFSNGTGNTITDLDITYDGELWFTGPAAQIGATDTLLFEYSLDATSLTAGTWTSVAALNFDAPTAGKSQFSAQDGNAAGNRVAGINGAISGLNIADGADFFVRWYIPDTPNGGTHAQGIDNFSITATVVPEPSTLALLGVGAMALISRLRKRR